MISQILRKWFGLVQCETCEVLRSQLDESNRERRELLKKLLTPPEPLQIEPREEELQPIKSQFVPWRVRQQMLEDEDKKKAQLMRDKAAEIAALEKELEIK